MIAWYRRVKQLRSGAAGHQFAAAGPSVRPLVGLSNAVVASTRPVGDAVDSDAVTPQTAVAHGKRTLNSQHRSLHYI